MTTKFSTSINIIRDIGRDINYIPTPNAKQVVSQIANDFKTGLRSFNIIGSYGTGKSAFLLALQQTVNGRKKYFDINILSNPSIGFINIIGEYKSLIDVFAETFEINNSKNISDNIFTEIFNRYHDLGKKNPLLFIVIDEFGKFLEYAGQNDPEKELYFMQELAEFVNNPEINVVLLTTVHQNFDAYALSLTQAQKQEWTKVKGRFKEIAFNEPVEQLLYLASVHLSEKPATKKHTKEINTVIELLESSKAFNVNEDYIQNVAQKLYPLDPLSAYILTLSLQKYGQNERSLFSFLESTDHTGLYQHSQKTKDAFYSIAEVYDYLLYNHFTFINSKYNPHFGAWSAIKAALEKVETTFEDHINDYFKIIKTIGLLNIFSLSGAKQEEEFFVQYAATCLGINNAATLIKDLSKKQIILYRKYQKRFVLFEGTDLDIESALIEAGGKLEEVTDIVTLVNKYYQLPPVVAKKVMYETGTPRLFEYKISSHPISDIPNGKIDGFINLVFNEKNIQNEFKNHSANNEEAVLYCYYKNAKTIKDLLFEIEKTKRVLEDNKEDRVAFRELNNIIVHQKNLLNHKILNNFYGNKSEVIWFFKGEEVSIKSKKDFNSQLSLICNTVYNKTPIYNNELVNKHKISASINSAKRNYYKALVYNWDKPQLGFDAKGFPPEKTIYLSLLESNSIILYADEYAEDIKPNNKNKFVDLWNISLDYLDSAKTSRRKVSEFVTLLNRRPFKLKQGFIDFWIPSFLFIKRDDFALFNVGIYVPFITDDIMELMVKNPDQFEIKTFAIEGVKLDIFTVKVLMSF